MKRALFVTLVLLVFTVFSFANTDITVYAGNAVVNSFNTTPTNGSLTAPWTINETYNGPGNVALQFLNANGTSLGDGNPTGTVHPYGKWISKTVTNNTSDVWYSFELELQSVYGTPSTDGDGLSFADGSSLTGSFFSSKFGTYTRIDTVRDYLNFSGGLVNPGESVNFTFVVTDGGTNNPFWLLQTPNKVDVVPEPASIMLLGTGLAGLAGAVRRKLMK